MQHSGRLFHNNNIKMLSFLSGYGRLLSILFYIGICPFKVHHKKDNTNYILSPDISIGYKLTIFVIIFAVISAQVYELMVFITSPTKYTSTTIALVQSLLNLGAYCFCILRFYIIGRSHAALLTGIQDFDRFINGHYDDQLLGGFGLNLVMVPTFEHNEHFQRILFIDLTAAVACILLNVLTVVMTGDYAFYTRWTEIFLEHFYHWIVLTFGLIISHISNVAHFVRRRMCWACSTAALDRLNRVLPLHLSAEKCFECIAMGWALKEKFENIFGVTIMLIVTIDVFLLIIAFYYAIMFSVMRTINFDWSVQWMTFVTYIALPIVRMVYLVWSIDGFGSEPVSCLLVF